MSLLLMDDESGQGLVEYALIIALVALVGVGALKAFADPVSHPFPKVTAILDSILSR